MPAKRRIVAKKRNKKTTLSRKSVDSVRRSQIKYVLEHPQYDYIVKLIRNGESLTSIARYFGEQGLISVKADTFLAYLKAFKSEFYSSLTVAKPDPVMDMVDSFDSLTNTDKPKSSVEQELMRVIELQKRRLSIAHHTEREMMLANDRVFRDVSVLIDAIDKLAKLRGAYPDSKMTHAFVGDQNVASNLGSIVENEKAQNRLVELVGKLADVSQKLGDG